MNGRERILTLINGGVPDCLPLMPITMMFAADQIGVRYRDYATDYRVLAEAQVRTAETFDFDYVSAISDPAREASACGAVVAFFDDQPPAIDEGRALLLDRSNLVTLNVPNPESAERMRDRLDGVALLRERAGKERIVEGWVEGPCAEGADLRGINNLMTDFFDDPAFVRNLFEFVLEMEVRFARSQVEAGADLIGIGDAAASLVGPSIYEEFVWSFEKRMVDAIHEMGAAVRLHICGNTRGILGGMGRLGCEIVDLDSLVSLEDARREMGPDQVLLGNIHPVEQLCHAAPEGVREALAECHRQAGPRYIVGAGCEVPRGTPPDNIRAMAGYAKAPDGLSAQGRLER